VTRCALPAHLNDLLRRQRVLAWALSLVTLGLNVGFFALMGFDAPVLSRIAFGRAVSVANVLALAIVMVFLASIWLFGHQAARIDQLMSQQKRS
jgi:uncharacterized membrane protein (DUF485 family)